MADDTSDDRRRNARHELDAEIEFIVDTDVVSASAVNISDGGIAFDVKEPLPILLQIRLDGEYFRKRGRLVRVTEGAESYRVAVAFAPDGGEGEGR